MRDQAPLRHAHLPQQGLAHRLITEGIHSAHTRGYTRAIIDTDIVSVPAAHAAYVRPGLHRVDASYAPSLRFLARELDSPLA